MNKVSYYWIVETKAPISDKGEPYSLLSEPLKVTVNATSHLDNQKITVYNALTNTDLLFTVVLVLLSLLSVVLL